MKKLVLIFTFISVVFVLCALPNYGEDDSNCVVYDRHRHHGHHGHHNDRTCTVVRKEPDWGTYCAWEYEYDWELKQCCKVKCFKKRFLRLQLVG